MANATILVVDDEPANLATLKQILDGHYALVFARSATECLAAARKHRPALILLDIQMPDMDGYTVCRTLKADPLTENTPVIFVSALGDVGDEAAGFAAGGVDYIIKPVSPPLVLARVHTHLSLVRATTLEIHVRQLEIERAKTARLSRILAVLSGTNSTIVRVREPQALVEEACHIAVEQGGFGLAWIGMTGTDGHTLTLAASQGVEMQAAASMRIAANEESGGEQLLVSEIPEEVLKTGKAACCNDVRLSAGHSRSCRDALDQGYLSIVGLPLTTSEQLAGVMVLYAREANYFDDEEMKLLNELAGDISFALQAIKYEKQASFLSYYDSLTALPNTTLFLDRLEQLVQAAARDHGMAFVMAINLDRFKPLNDSLGRHVGDQVLRITAKRLGASISNTCTVTRIGADNFAIAGTLPNNEAINTLCEQIIAILNEPLSVDHQSVQISARLGVALYPDDGGDGASLFHNAEAALKQSKLAKTAVLFYSPEINARLAEKAEHEQQLRDALEQQHFVMHYQPKVALSSGRIAGAEALIRWQHPERGLIPPTRFIPLAEETGLIVPIGEWVIRSVCAQQAAWLRAGVPIVPVALNLSALQFKQGNVLEIVKDALSSHALDPRWIELELTESLVMDNTDEAQKAMHAFRDLGLSLSLDDFGTGYSSLAYLRRFPFNTVKIDYTFVTEITRSPEDAVIATAIVAMAHSLNMHVVAEGVETEAQLRFLKTRQCDQIQGFYFSPPVAPAEFAIMLETDKHIAADIEDEAAQPTLLVVDNDPVIVAALQRSLQGNGYRILSAGSGAEALDLLASSPVQVILCDQLMPEMSGPEFLAIAAKLYPDTMRIVLSDHDDLQSILKVINCGDIHRFLTKPWDDALLQHNIREAFRRYRRAA